MSQLTYTRLLSLEISWEILFANGPHNPAWEGVLYASEKNRHRISGGTLATQARVPFELDGLRCESVLTFYDALKNDDPDTRTKIAAAIYDGSRRSLRKPPQAHDTFEYDGKQIAVGSAAHLVLIARAIEAKIRAHAVRAKSSSRPATRSSRWEPRPRSASQRPSRSW